MPLKQLPAYLLTLAVGAAAISCKQTDDSGQQGSDTNPYENNNAVGDHTGIHRGELTYYDLGVGHCQENDSGRDETHNVASLSHLLMGAETKSNLCFKTVTIKANGQSTTVIVKDKCMGCSIHDIDVSRKVFKDLWGGLEKGRTEVEWFFND